MSKKLKEGSFIVIGTVIVIAVIYLILIIHS